MATLRSATFDWLLVLASLAAPALGQGGPTIEQVIATATAAETFRAVALSPDGGRVAWVEAVRDPDGRPTPRGALFVADLSPTSGSAPRRITAAPAQANPATPAITESDPAWSPDGRRLAFVSDAVGGETQLFVLDLTSPGPPRQVTQLHGHLSVPRFSPDGRSIAFLFIEGRKGEAGPLQATARDAGVVGEHPEEQRLGVVDVGAGGNSAVRLLTPDDLYVYEYDWAPDGKSFAATAAHGSGDDNWYVAELYAIGANAADTPGTPKSLWKPPLSIQLANPRVSPDGRSVALIGGLMSDEGLTGGDVWLVPFGGTGGSGEARNLTPGRAASPAWLAWTSPTRLLVVEQADQDTAVTALDLPGGRASTLWHGPESLSDGGGLGLSLGRDGHTSALIHSDFSHPPEVWAGPLGVWKPVSRANARFAPAWGEAKSLHWTTDAPGGRVQGWLLAPPHVEPGKRYPLAVVIHGGPASVHRAGWPVAGGILASQGYYVLLPNPRGSYGQGEEFTRGNVKDFGYGDLRDILGGVDAALGSGAPLDPARVGLFGWSYGGYMAMWVVTQTDRFRAVVAGAGIANWQSYYGENRIDRWMIPYFGASVYDDPWIYARSAPLTFITRVKTPTLVLQGERDAEVPAPQAYEFWHALKTLGVETELVIYPDEGHRFVKPGDNLDRYRRVVDWLERHLK